MYLKKVRFNILLIIIYLLLGNNYYYLPIIINLAKLLIWLIDVLLINKDYGFFKDKIMF